MILYDFRIFDDPFAPNSFLVATLGIPKPSSMVILALGALCLLRDRRRQLWLEFSGTAVGKSAERRGHGYRW